MATKFANLIKTHISFLVWVVLIFSSVAYVLVSNALHFRHAPSKVGGLISIGLFTAAWLVVFIHEKKRTSTQN